MPQENNAIPFLTGLTVGTLVQVTTPHPQIETHWALVTEPQAPDQLRLIEVPSGKPISTPLAGAFDWAQEGNLAIQCGLTVDQDAVVLRYLRVPCPVEATQTARLLLQAHQELRNPQYADHSWITKHLLALAKAAPITITPAQLEVLMADVSMAIARHGYKCPTHFAASELDTTSGINAADLYNLLVDLKRQYGQPQALPPAIAP